MTRELVVSQQRRSPLCVSQSIPSRMVRHGLVIPLIVEIHTRCIPAEPDRSRPSTNNTESIVIEPRAEGHSP